MLPPETQLERRGDVSTQPAGCHSTPAFRQVTALLLRPLPVSCAEVRRAGFREPPAAARAELSVVGQASSAGLGRPLGNRGACSRVISPPKAMESSARPGTPSPKYRGAAATLKPPSWTGAASPGALLAPPLCHPSTRLTRHNPLTRY